MNKGLIKYHIARLNLYYGTHFDNPVFDLAHRSSALFAKIYATLKDSQKLGMDDFVISESDPLAFTKLEVHTYAGQSRIEIYPSSLVIYALDMIKDEGDFKVCFDYITDCEQICRDACDVSLLGRKITVNLWAKVEDRLDDVKMLLRDRGASAFPFIDDLPHHFLGDIRTEIKMDFSLNFSLKNSTKAFRFAISESPSSDADLFIRYDLSLPSTSDLRDERRDIKNLFDEIMLNLGLTAGADL